MLNRLKNKNRQIPNGFRFIQPQSGQEFPNIKGQWLSFDSMVREVINHRLGNKPMTTKFNLATDYPTVADEVEAYNVALCIKHGWNDFLTTGVIGDPKYEPLVQQNLASKLVAAGANLVGGARVLTSWLGHGSEPVPTETSNARAQICSDCPQNEVGDLTSFFTIPAAKLIQSWIEDRNKRKLSTQYDPQLGVCQACGCPLKLKVHTPIDEIRKALTAEAKINLDPRCWVTKE